MIERVGVAGAGAWGTALALLAGRNARQVVLWARREALAATIEASRENAPYLPGIRLDPAIRATADPTALGTMDVVLLAVPAQHLRAICRRLASRLPARCPVVVCAKGIEQTSCALMSEVLAEALPERPVAVLSGPTFAAEVARGLPAAATLAGADPVLGRALAEVLGVPHFRPYLSDDVVGAQVGGAVKNVIAIACGIIAGRALGDSARAALITRGLSEITRLAVAKGGRAETLMGLSGLGDLTLTCSAVQSRNFSLGLALGRGERLEDLLARRQGVAEGLFSAPAVPGLAARLGLEMPISEAVRAVLHDRADIDAEITALLARPYRSEYP